MKTYKITIQFEQDKPPQFGPPSEDALVRILRNFEPAPTSASYTAGNTRVVSFACEADTDFAAGSIAVDLFDRLTAHTSNETIHPKHWQSTRA